MIMTMLGFLVAVCADAIPPQARRTAIIAVARKLRLIIDVSFQLPNLLSGQRMCFLLGFHSARSGPTTTHRCGTEKHPMDQRSNESSARVARGRCVQILRKFGAPPKIRSFLLWLSRRRQRRAFVTPLIYWTFPMERAAASALARFLRGDVGRSQWSHRRQLDFARSLAAGRGPFATQGEQQ